MGKPLPKWAVYAGVGGAAVAVIYYYRKKSSASGAVTAAAAATSTDQYPPDGTTGDPSDPYSVDPATGQTYGDEAAGSGGTYGAFSAAGTSDQGIIGYDANGNPIYAPGYEPASGTTTGGPPFSTNSDWANWVIAPARGQRPEPVHHRRAERDRRIPGRAGADPRLQDDRAGRHRDRR